MKIVTWFKSLSWVAIAGVAAAAFVFVKNAMRASQLEQRAVDRDSKAEILLLDKTKKNLVAAKKLQVGAADDKKQASSLKLIAEQQMKELGEKDANLADIADRFNKRKLRDTAG